MRILLVEDEPDAARMLAKGLREHAYAVDLAADGDAAVYQASINDYDAIVLDVMLPGRDGLKVCQDLRQRGSPVPVLMLTARDAVEDRIAGLDSGADDYLAKPYAFGELLARLRALIRRGTRSPVPVRRTASTVAFGIAAEAKEGLDLPAAAADAASELRIPGTALAVYDLNGGLLAARWENFEPEAAGDHGLREGLATVPSSAAQWRRLTTRQRYQGAEYFVVNAVPLDQINKDAALVRSSLLTVVPLTVLLAAAGGWLLARSALRPISRLAAEAGQMSQDQPDARLSVPQGEDELSALARAFNSLLHRLQTAIQSQRQFMADASHELRTPVSVIRSAADVTLSRSDRSIEDYRDSMNVIEEQARRLSRLVDDLFLLARADADGRPLLPTRFYLDDLLSECARAVGVLTRSKDGSRSRRKTMSKLRRTKIWCAGCSSIFWRMPRGTRLPARRSRYA